LRNQPEPEDNTGRLSTRRQFVYAVGGVVGISVAGWVLLDRVRGRPGHVASSETLVPSRPKLRSDLTIQADVDGANIYRTLDGTKTELVCRVNESGLHLLREVDGRHTVSELARSLLAKMGRSPDLIESTESTVAAFLAELGAAGLLIQPFYTNIERAEVAS
jgi:hypothetical protein